MPATQTYYLRGHKRYELANHLGNVLATVSDKRAVASTESLADIHSLQDYYPTLYNHPLIAHNRPYAAASHFLDAELVFVFFARLGEASALLRARGRVPAGR